jgi:hypothetical protein
MPDVIGIIFTIFSHLSQTLYLQFVITGFFKNSKQTEQISSDTFIVSNSIMSLLHGDAILYMLLTKLSMADHR